MSYSVGDEVKAETATVALKYFNDRDPVFTQGVPATASGLRGVQADAGTERRDSAGRRCVTW